MVILKDNEKLKVQIVKLKYKNYNYEKILDFEL